MQPMSGHSTVQTAPRKAACATHRITVPRPSAQATKPIFTKSQETPLSSTAGFAVISLDSSLKTPLWQVRWKNQVKTCLTNGKDTDLKLTSH